MRFYSLKEYIKKEYNEPLYKLSLSCSNTCPNRDGKLSTGGCIFCSNVGSGDFADNSSIPINKQIEHAKKLVSKKFKGTKYIAYFQAFTSTYRDINYLRKVFFETISRDDIAILSIATRPDCLDDNILSLLNELNNIKPVWVELGLQTLNENTAITINRQYKNEVYFNAVKKLHSIKVNVITHLIIGLPGESNEEIINTAKTVGKITDGVKFTVLYVLKNTKLFNLYNENKYTPLSLDEYTEILSRYIEVTPKNVVIHRITGDGNKNELIAPLWTANKKYVLQYIYDYLDNNSIEQGKK